MLERRLSTLLMSVWLVISPSVLAATTVDAGAASSARQIAAGDVAPAVRLHDNPLLRQLAEGTEAAFLAAPDEPYFTRSEPEPITPPPTHTLRVMLDWYINPYHAPLIVARERGLFDREGLDVTLTAPADPSVPAKLVAADRAELALTSQPTLHHLVARGMPLVRVATLIPLPLSGLLVRDDAGIDSLARLKGKTIGYATESVAQVYLDALLEQQPLTANDVTLKPLDFALGRALADGDVDAIIAPLRPTERDGLARQGVATHELTTEDSGLPLYDALIIVANRDTLAQHRRDISHFLKALEQATVWIIQHPDAAWNLIRKAEPALDTTANADAWPNVVRYFALRPALLQPERYRGFERYLNKRGLRDEVTPLSNLAVELDTP
ncbi:ABC transporter substrate-binding protein [Modicisalibacter tunisiensis]|uniref:ABC transporter substrate-binding protein n=1 Tax=Modicisalibacter TaxID=574347 RepID=UPI0013D89ADD|nr:MULTISPECIES: ABC transporter substrate-binding protein [Modicisalibacter]MBZ9538091.1 ABC transporter substrate-binding protein [Modicisalibacter tunisiensis]